MGLVIKAEFKTKIASRFLKFDPNHPEQDYHEEIFAEMFLEFPQFKAHVAAYIERNYCTVVNDEDHGDPRALFTFLKPEEVRRLNQWILTRKTQAVAIKQTGFRR